MKKSLMILVWLFLVGLVSSASDPTTINLDKTYKINTVGVTWSDGNTDCVGRICVSSGCSGWSGIGSSPSSSHSWSPGTNSNYVSFDFALETSPDDAQNPPECEYNKITIHSYDIDKTCISSPETCNNIDDDCDGQIDNIFDSTWKSFNRKTGCCWDDGCGIGCQEEQRSCTASDYGLTQLYQTAGCAGATSKWKFLAQKSALYGYRLVLTDSAGAVETVTNPAGNYYILLKSYYEPDGGYPQTLQFGYGAYGTNTRNVADLGNGFKSCVFDSKFNLPANANLWVKSTGTGTVHFYNYRISTYMPKDVSGLVYCNNGSAVDTSAYPSPIFWTYGECRPDNTLIRTNSCGSAMEILSCEYASINSSFWSSLNSVGQIDQAQSGDTVLMVFGGQNLEGKTIDYQVQNYTSGFVWYNPVTWFGSKVWSSSPKISGDAYEPWVVQGNQDGKLRFNATINGTNIGNISNNLTINNTGSNPNFKPVAVISNPINNARYKLDANIPFTQASYDQDDLLRITWDFGNTNTYSVNDFALAINSSAANINRSYNRVGVYTVTLNVKEMNRNQEDSQKVNITILRDGVNVIPIISSPPNSSVHGNGSVYFNANQSFVINCSALNTMPEATFNTSDNLLSCKYLLEPGTIPLDSQKIYLNWSFGDGRYKAGYWNQSSHLNLTSFTHTYLTASTHRINLNMKFNWTG